MIITQVVENHPGYTIFNTVCTYIDGIAIAIVAGGIHINEVRQVLRYLNRLGVSPWRNMNRDGILQGGKD